MIYPSMNPPEESDEQIRERESAEERTRLEKDFRQKEDRVFSLEDELEQAKRELQCAEMDLENFISNQQAMKELLEERE